MNKLTNKNIRKQFHRDKAILINNPEYSQVIMYCPIENFVIHILDYVLIEHSYKKAGASLQIYKSNEWIYTRCIKHGIYRQHVVRYEFSLSCVLAVERTRSRGKVQVETAFYCGREEIEFANIASRLSS